jgi:hypothetical protein
MGVWLPGEPSVISRLELSVSLPNCRKGSGAKLELITSSNLFSHAYKMKPSLKKTKGQGLESFHMAEHVHVRGRWPGKGMEAPRALLLTLPCVSLSTDCSFLSFVING